MRPWLGIDSATDWASVAVVTDAVLAERSWRGGRNHTTELTRAVCEVLAGARVSVTELQGIAVAIGPGSYTGLRVGLAVAKGMALVGGAAVVGVPTLHALAAALSPPATERSLPLHAFLRAGRGRHAVATYPPEPEAWPAPEGLRAGTLEEWLAEHEAPGWVAGELEAGELETLASAGFAIVPVGARARRAAHLVDVARAVPVSSRVDLAALVPVYLGREPG